MMWGHVGGEGSARRANVLSKAHNQIVVLPEGRCWADRSNAREVASTSIRLSGAVKNSVVERLRTFFAARAGENGVGIPPVWVGSQIRLPGSHLMDSASRKPIQTHEGMGDQGGAVAI